MTEKAEPRYQVTVERTSAGTFVARTLLPEAVRLSHDRLCTVSNTVRRGTPVTMAVADPSTG